MYVYIKYEAGTKVKRPGIVTDLLLTNPLNSATKLQ